MSETDNNIIAFRDDTPERAQIAERNRQAAKRILEQAGIAPEHPDYKHYYGLTMANVHNSGLYGVYDDSVEQMFVETLRNPDMTLAQYKEATRQYNIQVIERQQLNASGSTFSGKDESYNALMEPYKETLKKGVAMREENGISFPKEFYDEAGKPTRRLVVELDANSAWNIVNSYAEKHQQSGVSFNGEAFVVDGNVQSPGKFFNSKAQKLERFVVAVQKDPTMLDLTDKELLDLVEKGDYEGIKELNKQRGIAHDNRNKPLRELLKADKDLFAETRTLLHQAGGNGENLVENVSGLSSKMKYNAELFHKETESGKFHAPKEEIDRIVFSVRPDDVARQSTFQDWKSCMNAVGCNHHYVDDAIGQGSIIAYGYNSKNPQKMISRILIHPYTNEKGETIYLPNSNLYGENNAAFKEMVSEVADRKFNVIRETSIYNRRQGLYNDGNPETVIKVKEGEKVVDLSAYSGKSLSNADLSKCERVIVGENMILDNVTLPKEFKLGENITLKNMELPEGFVVPDGIQLDNVTLPKEFKLGENITLKNMKLPEGFVVPDGVLLDDVKLPKEFKLGKNVTLKNMELHDVSLLDKIALSSGTKFSGNLFLSDIKISDGTDLSGVSFLSLGDDVVWGKDIKLPEQLEVSGKIPDGMDLSGVKELYVNNNMELGKGIKFPDSITLGYGCTIPEGTDLSGIKNLTLKFSKLPEGVKLPENIRFSGIIPDGADLSTVKNVVIQDCEDVNKVLALPDHIAVKFEKAVLVGDAETAKKLLKKDLSEAYLIVTDDKMFKGMEIPAGVPIVKIDEANMQIIAVNADDKLKKQFETMFSHEAVSLNYITPEEFEKSSGAIFSNVKSAAPAEKAVENITENAAIKEAKEKAETAATRFEEKVAVKTGGIAAEPSVEQTAKKRKYRAKAAAANAKFDRAVDNMIDKGAETLNNSSVGRAYQKTAEKIGNTKVAKTTQKIVSQGTGKLASTSAGKVVTKTVTKVAGSAAAKSVIKKIPVVSALAGAWFAWERIKEGQWASAGCELLSGVAGCFPGVGTAASVALDAGLAANDIHDAVKASEGETSEVQTTEKTAVRAQPRMKYNAKQANANKPKEKKETRRTVLTAEQQRALMEKQVGRA